MAVVNDDFRHLSMPSSTRAARGSPHGTGSRVAPAPQGPQGVWRCSSTTPLTERTIFTPSQLRLFTPVGSNVAGQLTFARTNVVRRLQTVRGFLGAVFTTSDRPWTEAQPRARSPQPAPRITPLRRLQPRKNQPRAAPVQRCFKRFAGDGACRSSVSSSTMRSDTRGCGSPAATSRLERTATAGTTS